MTIREKMKELGVNFETPIIEPIWMDYEYKKMIEFPDSYAFYYVDKIRGYETRVGVSK